MRVLVTGCGTIEIAAIDPIASMQAVENPQLQDVAGTIAQKLKHIVEAASPLSPSCDAICYG